MDIDMSLDDLAAANKKPTNPRPTGSRTHSGPRRSNGGDAAPRAQAPYSRPPPASTGSSWQHDMYSGPGGSRGGHAAAAGGAGGARPPRAIGDPNVPTARIRIEGLHYEIQKAQLEKIFSQCGKIVDGPTIQYDRSGRSTGIATVTYDTVSAAKWAREKLDGQKANGEPIKITYAHVPAARPTAPTGPGAALLGRLGAVAGESRAAPTGPRTGGRAVSSGKPASAPAAARGPRPARGVGAGAGDKGGRPAKKGPANQDDLDKELAAFMKTDESAAAAPAPAPAAAAAPAVGEAAMEE